MRLPRPPATRAAQAMYTDLDNCTPCGPAALRSIPDQELPGSLSWDRPKLRQSQPGCLQVGQAAVSDTRPDLSLWHSVLTPATPQSAGDMTGVPKTAQTPGVEHQKGSDPFSPQALSPGA